MVVLVYFTIVSGIVQRKKISLIQSLAALQITDQLSLDFESLFKIRAYILLITILFNQFPIFIEEFPH